MKYDFLKWRTQIQIELESATLPTHAEIIRPLAIDYEHYLRVLHKKHLTQLDEGYGYIMVKNGVGCPIDHPYPRLLQKNDGVR